MPAVILASPGPVFHDPHVQSVHSNSTVTASGSKVFTGYGASEVSLFINVKASPTGTLPTIQYTIQEVDPGDGSTVIGNTVSSTVINAIGIQRITLLSTYGGSINVSWVIGGTGTPSFTQVYATLTAKVATTLITDGTNGPAAIKASSTGASSTDPSLVVALSPNSYDSAIGYSSYSPNPNNIEGSASPLGVDPSGNIMTRGAVTTDEVGFRDSFVGTSLNTTLTGTLTFVNGSKSVTGVGTSFTSQVTMGQYIKLSSDGESAYAQIYSVTSDTSLTLTTIYSGSSASNAAVVSNWSTVTGSGGSITVTGSNLSISNGTGAGVTTYVQRLIDYAPLQMYSILYYGPGVGTSQVAFFGFQDNPSNPQAQVIVEVDASLTTDQIRLISSLTSASTETINKVFSLPYGFLNTSTLQYKITTTQTSTTLEVSQPNTNISAVVGTVTTHLPAPYTEMYAVAGMINSSSVTTSGTIYIDVIYVNNQDRVETALSFTGEPITVVQASDLQPSLQIINAQDVGSSSTVVANGQVFITGTPTANSYAQFNSISVDTIKIQSTGTWTGTLSVEKSLDGGTTWVAGSLHQTGTNYITNNFTSNFIGSVNVSGTGLLRVRATSTWTGNATIKVVTTNNPNIVYTGSPVRIIDSVTQSTGLVIKPASTAAVVTDNAAVVSLSPNSPICGEFQTGFYPDQSVEDDDKAGYIQIDSGGNLMTRGPVFTDEGGFRDPFHGTSITTNIGTCTFTNGSNAVTGSGTTFTDLSYGLYVKLTSDSETAFAQIQQIQNDTSLTLTSDYTGSTATAASVMSNWGTITDPSGSITVGSGNATITNGITSGATTYLYLNYDYSPIQIVSSIAFSPGVGPGQIVFMGFQDTTGIGNANAQVLVELDSSLAKNQIRFVTSSYATAVDAYSQVLTLPNGWLVTQQLQYKVSLSQTVATLEVGIPNTGNTSVVLSVVNNNIPVPYTILNIIIGLYNSISITSTGTLTVAESYTESSDRVEIGNSFTGEPIGVNVQSFPVGAILAGGMNPITGTVLAPTVSITNGIAEQSVSNQRGQNTLDAIQAQLSLMFDLIQQIIPPVITTQSIVGNIASSPFQQTIGTTASVIYNSGPCKQIRVVNTGTTKIYLAFNGQVPTNTAYHIALSACTAINDGTGGTFIDDVAMGPISAISSAAGGTVCVTAIN